LAVGLKVTLTLQLAPAVREPVQPLENGKSAAFPVTPMLVIVSVVVPVFLRVTDLTELDVFTFWLPKFRLPGLEAA
jgi:hypothetical protein